MKLLRERDNIVVVKDAYDKIIDMREITLQEFILTGLREGLGYHQKPFNPRIKTLIKTSDPSFSKSAQKGLEFYFIRGSNNAKILNQS